ncbi:MAG: hypothetical protein ACKOCW_07925 [Planctomycetaceae bacterium]
MVDAMTRPTGRHGEVLGSFSNPSATDWSPSELLEVNAVTSVESPRGRPNTNAEMFSWEELPDLLCAEELCECAGEPLPLDRPSASLVRAAKDDDEDFDDDEEDDLDEDDDEDDEEEDEEEDDLDDEEWEEVDDEEEDEDEEEEDGDDDEEEWDDDDEEWDEDEEDGDDDEDEDEDEEDDDD